MRTKAFLIIGFPSIWKQLFRLTVRMQYGKKNLEEIILELDDSDFQLQRADGRKVHAKTTEVSFGDNGNLDPNLYLKIKTNEYWLICGHPYWAGFWGGIVLNNGARKRIEQALIDNGAKRITMPNKIKVPS